MTMTRIVGAISSWLVVAPMVLVGCTGDGGDSGADGPSGAPSAEAGTTGASGSSGTAETGATVCMPGELRDCPCPGGGTGSQVCIVDGSGFYPCFCGATEVTGVDPSVGEVSTGASDPTDDATSSSTGPIGAVPTVGIQHPADGDMRTIGQAIPFDGSAIDVEDGVLMGPSLVWTSDLDGELGTGANIMAPLATEGLHEVTLSATDSDGNVGTASITLDLSP